MINGKSILIRRAGKPYLSQICNLENEIFRASDRFPKSRLSYLLKSPNATFFVCFHRELPIAYGIALKNKLRNGKRKGRIYSLGVLRNFRGDGVGSTLLNELEDSLIADGVRFITLETKVGKSGAKEFFEKRGYQVSDFLRGYYSSADGLRMKKHVFSLSQSDVSKDRISQRRRV